MVVDEKFAFIFGSHVFIVNDLQLFFSISNFSFSFTTYNALTTINMQNLFFIICLHHFHIG
jgi:hypothetical protein